jgi:hypothetical protein
MSKRKLPSHIPGTVEQWRRRKRREWRAVVKAIQPFTHGCVYTPALAPFDELRRNRDAITSLLQGNWNP